MDLVTAMFGLITAALAFIFFYFPWQTFVVDQTRQRLFEIRDRWFDYSVSLTEEADKAAAAKIRNEINYLIRRTHQVTVPIVCAAVFARDVLKIEREASEDIFSAIKGFKSLNAAKEAQQSTAAVFGCIAWCMIRRSLLALALLPFVIVFGVLISATFKGVSSGISWVESLIEGVASHKGGRFA